MKAVFHQKLINDPFGDPCLYLRMIRRKRALLFDIGDIRTLSSAEMHKLTDVFVTHTHIDHFIGFDALLRIILRRDIPLNIYGPMSIIRSIEGKLRGYTWNLIHDYPTIINVYGFGGSAISHIRFTAEGKFRKIPVSRKVSDSLLLDDPLFRVHAVSLDHGTPCLAYCLEEKEQINFDRDRLLKMGFSVGPWLTELRKRLEQNRMSSSIVIDGKKIRVRDLGDIVIRSRGRKIAFATDIGMSSANRKKLIQFVSGSDICYCEAYFLDKDRERALQRHHLTAKECGLIANEAGVKQLALMHFSPKYLESAELLIQEAEAAFGGKVIVNQFSS